MRLSIKLWFFLPSKLSEVEILCTSRRYLVNYSVNWASTPAAHITMSATLPFVPSDRTFPFHQRNIFSVFPHPPVFTFAFTAKTAMRVKNCHFWKQEQFVGNDTHNSWQVPQVSFFFWGALKQNQMSSHCNILILKTRIYRPEHLLVHVRVKVQLIESSHLLQVCATLEKRFGENYKRFFWATHLERQDADEGFLESKVGFKLGHHVLKGGSLKPDLWRWSGHHCERQNSQTCFIKHKML